MEGWFQILGFTDELDRTHAFPEAQRTGSFRVPPTAQMPSGGCAMTQEPRAVREKLGLDLGRLGGLSPEEFATWRGTRPW